MSRPRLQHHRVNWRPTVELWRTVEQFASDMKIRPMELVNIAVAEYIEGIVNRRGMARMPTEHWRQLQAHHAAQLKARKPRRRRGGAKTGSVEHAGVFHGPNGGAGPVDKP